MAPARARSPGLANTAMSSITYRYRGKEGLYLAAADHIAGHMAREMAPAPEAEEGVDEHDRDRARAALHRLCESFVDQMASDETADWSLFIMREQLTPGEAFERIWGGMMGRVLKRMATPTATATGARQCDSGLNRRSFHHPGEGRGPVTMAAPSGGPPPVTWP